MSAEGIRKLIAVALGLASYTIIAFKLGIDAAQTAMPFIASAVGSFLGFNIWEHKIKANGGT